MALFIPPSNLLTATTPSAIGTASVGTAMTAARADHVHNITSSIITTALGYTPWHAGNDGSASGLDADLLDGYQTSTPGDRWGVIPVVAADGVTEVGRYIDFHETDADASDYTSRITSTSGVLYRSIPGPLSYKVWDEGTDGAGSGLDADLIDGVDSTRIIYGDNNTGTDGSPATNGANSIVKSGFYRHNGVDFGGGLLLHVNHPTQSGYRSQLSFSYGNSPALQFRNRDGTDNNWYGPWTIWNSGNDGAGSGLDADKLDGYDWNMLQAKGMNLVVNGSALLASNYNFSSFTYTGVEAQGSPGSFYTDTLTADFKNDEYLPVDPGKFYEFRGWMKAVTAAPTPHAYLGGAFYDADKNLISPYHHMFGANTHTTLAAPLRPGDTTITVASTANWYNGATATNRCVTVWGYRNALGYTYPAYTYSRYVAYNSTLGGYAVDGFTSTVITLTAPWAYANPADAVNGEWPIGTPISNGYSGGTYKYFVAANVTEQAAWTEYRGTIGGTDLTGTNATTAFPPGAAYAKLVFLLNRDTSAVACRTYLSNVWFSEVTPKNLLNTTGGFSLQTTRTAADGNTDFDIDTLNDRTLGNLLNVANKTLTKFRVTWAGNIVSTALAADAGNTLRDSPGYYMRGRYWNGSASTDYDCTLVHDLTATTPTSKLSVQFNAVEKASIANDGRITSSTAANSSAFMVTQGAFYSLDTSGNARIFRSSSSDTNVHRAAVTDGASAVAHKFGNANALTTSGAKIVSFLSDDFSTERSYINKDGVYVTTSGTAFAVGSVSGIARIQNTSGNVTILNSSDSPIFRVNSTTSTDLFSILRGQATDGATAVGLKFGNVNSLTTTGAKIASFYSDNGATEKAYINKDGAAYLAGGLADDTSHGNRGGGALHANATTSTAGFMSGADKTKLDGIAAPPWKGALHCAVANGDPEWIYKVFTQNVQQQMIQGLPSTEGWAVDFYYDTAITVNAVRFYCYSNTGGETIELAIYRDSDGARMWASGTIDFAGLTSGTLAKVTASLPVTLAANTRYWLACTSHATTSSAIYLALKPPNMAQGAFAAGAALVTAGRGAAFGYPVLSKFTTTSGAMPTTLPALTNANVYPPFVLLDNSATP